MPGDQLIFGRHVAFSPLKSEEFALGRDSFFLPFEILYGRPPPLVNLTSQLDTRELGNMDLYRQLQGLGHTISQIHTRIIDRIPIP